MINHPNRSKGAFASGFFYEVWRADVPASETRGSREHQVGSFETEERAKEVMAEFERQDPGRKFKIMRRPRPKQES